MHVDKLIHVHPVIHLRPGVTELIQGQRTKTAEHQQAAGLEHPLKLRKCRPQIHAPLQRQIGKHQIELLTRQRQALCIATNPPHFASPTIVLRRLFKHAG